MSDKRYFGGSTVHGKVRRLSATSFKELVERYFNVPVTKKFTRREYDSYDKDTKDTSKDGPFVTAAVFNGDGVTRNNENCIAVSLALLDFDSLSKKDEAEGFVNYAQQLYESPGAIRDALYPYNFVCYETISSRKGDRRVRIIVDLAEMPVKLHRAVVTHIASLLGVDINRWKGRIESMTLSLPMFRPVEFLGEDYAAVLCSRTDGQEMDDLDIPETELFELSATGGDRSYAYNSDADDCDLTNLPVVGLTVEDIEPVLKYINPDESYHTWVMVGMALRHQFRGETEAKQAYDVFDDWSSNGPKYVDEDETYLKWRSFRPDATGRAPVTLRSVFEKAKAGGWDPTSLSKKVKRDLMDWIKKCVDPDELMQRGAAKIAALPFKNDIVEEALMTALGKRITELSPENVVISKAALKKAVRSHRHKNALADDDEKPQWMRPWVYITTRNVFRHMGNGIELSPEAFNNTFGRDLMSLAPDSESALTGRPGILPVHFALNVKDMKRVDGTTYDPRHGGEEPFFEYNGRLFLNEYRVSTIPKLDPENAAKAGKILTHAVKTLMGEHWRTLMDFLAHTVQYPGVLIRWAPLIQSAQGAGKNMVLNVVGYALGFAANYKVINAKQVMSDYNEWVGGAQLIVLDEIKIPGHNKAELSNSLKDLIPNDTVSVSQKFQDLRVIQNVANKIALTNWHDALYVEDTDRRWWIVKSPLQTERDCMRLAESGHFDRLAKLYKHGGAVRQFLLNWEISSDFPVNSRAPRTSARNEMIGESKSQIQEEVEDIIEGGALPTVGKDLVFTPHLIRKLAHHGTSFKPSIILRKLGYEPYDEGNKVLLGTTRGVIWVHRDNHDPDYGDPLAILSDRYEGEEETDF